VVLHDGIILWEAMKRQATQRKTRSFGKKGQIPPLAIPNYINTAVPGIILMPNLQTNLK
jgi:hypothetical protein